jgi:MarR family transcriptional regulator for hemolysin
MTSDFENKIEDLAHEIKEQSNRLSMDNFSTLVHVADILERFIDVQMRKVGINQTNYTLLNHLIVLGGRATPTELSKRVFRSKHAITRAVDTLEKEGLVKREGIGEDRRNRKVVVTAKGLNLVRKMVPFREQIGSMITEPLNDEEARGFSTMLKRLRRHMVDLMEKV